MRCTCQKSFWGAASIALCACPSSLSRMSFERYTFIPCPSRFRPGGRLSCTMLSFVFSDAVFFFPKSFLSADPRHLQRCLIAKYRYHLNLVTLQSKQTPINMSDAAELFILSGPKNILSDDAELFNVSDPQHCLIKRNSSVLTHPPLKIKQIYPRFAQYRESDLVTYYKNA